MSETTLADSVPRVSEHGARIAASRIGCTTEEYRQHEAADEFWCGLCCRWVSRERFVIMSSKRGGRCRPCANDAQNIRYRSKHATDWLPMAERTRCWVLTPEGATAVSSAESTAEASVETQHLVPSAAAASSGSPALDPEWTDAMERRAIRSGRPHGLDCPCLMCSDVRVAIGAKPLDVGPRRLLVITRDGQGRGEQMG